MLSAKGKKKMKELLKTRNGKIGLGIVICIVLIIIIVSINLIYIITRKFSDIITDIPIINYKIIFIVRYAIRTNIRIFPFLVHFVLKKYYLSPFFKKCYVNQL